MKFPILATTCRTVLSLTIAAMLSTTPVHAQTDIDVAQDSSLEAVNSGDFRDAISQWSPVIEKMRATRNASAAADSESSKLVGLSLAKLLLRRGEAYLRLGFYNRASDDLQETMALANELELPVLQSMVIGSLGDLHTAAQHNSSFRGKKLSLIHI